MTLTNSTGGRLTGAADYFELQRLVVEAAWRVDEGRSETLADLFVDDGELDLGEGVLKGRGAIRAWGRTLDEAHTYKVIRHVAGNMRFVAADENTAEGGTVLTVFMDDDQQSSIPWVVGEDHDRLVRTDDGWRFARRRWTLLFTRPLEKGEAGAHRERPASPSTMEAR